MLQHVLETNKPCQAQVRGETRRRQKRENEGRGRDTGENCSPTTNCTIRFFLPSTSSTTPPLSLCSTPTEHSQPKQGVADMLAQFGIKKPAVQRALDALAEEGKVTCKVKAFSPSSPSSSLTSLSKKTHPLSLSLFLPLFLPTSPTPQEFGKAKIYFAPQQDAPVLSKDELSALAAKKIQLEEELRAASLALATHRAALAKADAEVPPEVVGQRIAAANSSISELEGKLHALKAEGAPPPVSADDMAAATKKLSTNLAAWSSQKAIFKEVWDAVSENLDTKNPRDLYEEIGVETDEGAGVNLAELKTLLPTSRGLVGKLRRV